eukprot:scaffold83865_cov87-Phaeocystis_antarctica.AAC.2
MPDVWSITGCQLHPRRSETLEHVRSLLPVPSYTSIRSGGVLSTTKWASATPLSPALLIAITTVRYVALCARTPTTAAGSGTDNNSSVAFTRSSNSHATARLGKARPLHAQRRLVCGVRCTLAVGVEHRHHAAAGAGAAQLGAGRRHRMLQAGAVGSPHRDVVRGTANEHQTVIRPRR